MEGERQKESSSMLARSVMKPSFRKVQVVYYLSKNGQLEQPHFIQVNHLLHHQLRLKDVLDRLALLRGRDMPALYSWSCKRSYKNGYVWNDLAENDVIFPSEGAEYVLKGSELIHGFSENLQQLQVCQGQAQVQGPKNRQPRATRRHTQPARGVTENKYEEDEFEDGEEYVNCAYTPCRISRGVSTDELELLKQTHSTTRTTHHRPTATELTTLDNSLSPPPSTTTSGESNTASKRFEDGDPMDERAPGRHSLFLHFIACGGGSVGFKGKTSRGSEQAPWTVGRKSSSLHKGVLFKAASEAKTTVEEDEIISCMSENPRFGNLQSEEKEYFSGSIVERMSEERADVVPPLKRSTSYDEKRRSKAATMEEVGEEEEEVEEEILKKKREKGAVALTGKCIPRKKSTSTSKPNKS